MYRTCGDRHLSVKLAAALFTRRKQQKRCCEQDSTMQDYVYPPIPVNAILMTLKYVYSLQAFYIKEISAVFDHVVNTIRITFM